MEKGYLAIVLHAHLPYVRHPEHEDFLEEDWLYEAITETYIPLLKVFEGLVNDGVDWRLTMSITPTLASMFSTFWNWICPDDNRIALLKSVDRVADKYCAISSISAPAGVTRSFVFVMYFAPTSASPILIQFTPSAASVMKS